MSRKRVWVVKSGDFVTGVCSSSQAAEALCDNDPIGSVECFSVLDKAAVVKEQIIKEVEAAQTRIDLESRRAWDRKLTPPDGYAIAIAQQKQKT